MRDLNYQLKQLCRHNRDGSYSTQARRLRDLNLMAGQLHRLGYRHMQAGSLKRKHVEALVNHWLKENLSAGTIKNRMVSLRWWAEKVNRNNVIAKSNDFYGIPHREFVSNQSKAKTIDPQQLEKVTDPHIKISLQFQAEFGLRREEAIKINPTQADQGEVLKLKASWTKGGRERVIPIRTQSQRNLLEKAKALVGRGHLIPPDRNYVQQLRIYERHTANAGLSKLHGLRHQYAQNRYRELTGWACPAAGGPGSKDLNAEQRIKDREARLIISKQLGHEREAVTAVYLGR